MKNRSCYDCTRKFECFSKSTFEKMKPGTTYKDITGYDCGALFTNYEELRNALFKIGEVIDQQSKRTSNKIIKEIAEKCGTSEYNVRLELYNN